MLTRGEIEAQISEGMARFQQEFIGRGPKMIHTYLLDELVVVRLQGVLTAAEQQLVRALPPEKGRDLLKQVRTELIEIARPQLDAMIGAITQAQIVSLHHDISTQTGEEVVIFTLSAAPVHREVAKR